MKVKFNILLINVLLIFFFGVITPCFGCPANLNEIMENYKKSLEKLGKRDARTIRWENDLIKCGVLCKQKYLTPDAPQLISPGEVEFKMGGHLFFTVFKNTAYCYGLTSEESKSKLDDFLDSPFVINKGSKTCEKSEDSRFTRSIMQEGGCANPKRMEDTPLASYAIDNNLSQVLGDQSKIQKNYEAHFYSFSPRLLSVYPKLDPWKKKPFSDYEDHSWRHKFCRITFKTGKTGRGLFQFYQNFVGPLHHDLGLFEIDYDFSQLNHWPQTVHPMRKAQTLRKPGRGREWSTWFDPRRNALSFIHKRYTVSYANIPTPLSPSVTIPSQSKWVPLVVERHFRRSSEVNHYFHLRLGENSKVKFLVHTYEQKKNGRVKFQMRMLCPHLVRLAKQL